MAKLLLAIDCSFGGHSVALVNDDQLLASCHHPRIFATEAIIASIDKILRRARYKLTDIRALAYGAGPGLFSGIRAACVTVQGIAFAMRLLIARVPTTLALAQLYQCDQALVAYPAYLKHFYMAAYVRSNALWHTKLEPSLVHVKRIPVLKGDWQLCSRRRSKLRVNLNRCVTGKLQYLPANQASIAPAVAQLGMRLWQSDQLLKPELALPLYVRHKVAFTRQERIANNA